MARYLIRVWLPDNPGMLGRVASAIGSVGASLVGVEILEQGGGYAIDEFVVDAVDSPNAKEKLIAALMLLEHVSVEEIVDSAKQIIDPRLDVLNTAAELVSQETVRGLQLVLVQRAQTDLNAHWAAVVMLNTVTDNVAVAVGEAPGGLWLRAFVEGSRMSEQGTGADDAAWADLVKSGAALVVGRDGRAFRQREREQLEAMANIADRLMEVLPA